MLLFQPDFSGINVAAALASIQAEGVTTLTASSDDIKIGGGYSGGNAVNITGTKYLKYPANGKFTLGKGAIELWFKPNWDTKAVKTGANTIFGANWNATQSVNFRFVLSSIVNLRFATGGITLPSGGYPYSDEPMGIRSCKTTTWNLLQVFWNLETATNPFVLFRINDRYHQVFIFPINTINALSGTPYFYIGSDLNGGNQFDGQISDISIYDDPASLLPVAIDQMPTVGTLASFHPETTIC